MYSSEWQPARQGDMAGEHGLTRRNQSCMSLQLVHLLVYTVLERYNKI